ncbi:MAG: hypothetical protein H7Z42_15045 [Roseiflexaceae bacterium]|nr:hypothetical protein [Roseiflexaceae bacterium]
MNRQDIKILALEQGYPCLTITLPTHRTSPDNRQDSIRLKNLVRQAAASITDDLGKRNAETVLSALEQLAETIDHEHNLDGLALFVSANLVHSYRLPFSLPERVIVGESFFIRDLVYAYNRTPHYWVLALSEQPTRLFDAVRDDLEEITTGSSFPLTHTGPGGASRLPGGQGVNRSAYRDDHMRAFMRSVDQALGRYLVADPLPVVLVGVDRWLSFFREVSNNNEYILTTLTGSHDTTSAYDLGQLVWPLAREDLAVRRSAIFGELQTAVGGQRSASTLGEVWRCAHEGRGATLVVEEGYHQAARIDQRGLLQLLPAGEALATTDLDDAVDEVIVTVLEKGGRVVFVDDGTLDDHSRIALILRY